MRHFLSAILLVFFLAVTANADVLIKQRMTTPAVAGEAGTSEVVDVWLSDGKLASVGKDSSVIIDMKAKTMWMLNHEEKSYIELAFPFDLSKMFTGEAGEMMNKMMEGTTVSVEKTADTKKVAGVDTVAYSVNMTLMGMQMPGTWWVANSGLPFEWKRYQELFAQLNQIMMSGGEKIAKEMAKVDGIPLATEMVMMGVGKITSEAIEIKDDVTPPAGTYAIPEGYKKKEHM